MPDTLRLSPEAAARSVAAVCRSLWEPLWPEWRRRTGYPYRVAAPSEAACIPSAFALHDLLTERVPAPLWVVRGGMFISDEGERLPHVWVETTWRRRRLIVDVTADQFGLPPILAGGTYAERYADRGVGMFSIMARRAQEEPHPTVWAAIARGALRMETPDA